LGYGFVYDIMISISSESGDEVGRRESTNGSVKVGDVVALDGVNGARRVGVNGAESTRDYNRADG
jgi:hypothetical protein